MKKKKLKSLKSLKNKADQLFSRFIRERDRHTCYTCGKVIQANESQNGHYISRKYLFYRYDERNCHCQCVGCNVFGKGNMTVYSLKMLENYKYAFLVEIEKNKNRYVGNTREFLSQIIQKYGQN